MRGMMYNQKVLSKVIRVMSLKQGGFPKREEVSMRKDSGFTFIEMVVTLVIVGLLAVSRAWESLQTPRSMFLQETIPPWLKRPDSASRD